MHGRRVIVPALSAGRAQARATELFTIAFSHLTSAQAITYTSLEPIYSPPAQTTASNGDLIAPENDNSQENGNVPAGISHHPASIPGEKLAGSIRGAARWPAAH
jgi:hypothetical protein